MMSTPSDRLRAALRDLADESSPPADLVVRARSTARRTRTRSSVAGAVAVIVVACGVTFGVHWLITGSIRGPSLAPATAPASPEGGKPGTPLTSGVRSPAGTLVLGTVFPGPGGSRAVLLVTGDPYRVLRDVVTAFQRAGYRASEESAHPCTAYHERAGAHGLTCQVNMQTPGADGLSRTVFLDLEVSADTRAYQSVLVVDFSEFPENPDLPVPPPGVVVDIPAGPAPDQPRQIPAVPTAGHAFGDPFGVLSGPYRVVAGSAMLVPPVHPGCATGGFVVVFKVTGDVREVVDAYVAQFQAQRLEIETNRTVPGGRYVSLGGAGAGDAQVVAVAGPAATYVLVQRCND